MNVTEPGRRAKRVAQIVRDCVSRFLVTQAADSRLSGVVITDARVSDDLSVAHLAFRFLNGPATLKEQRQTIRQLQLLSGRLRKLLGPELRLRRVPEIRFAFDTGIDAQQRVEMILEEIRAESTK
jgi:ribosome-binding factor A